MLDAAIRNKLSPEVAAYRGFDSAGVGSDLVVAREFRLEANSPYMVDNGTDEILEDGVSVKIRGGNHLSVIRILSRFREVNVSQEAAVEIRASIDDYEDRRFLAGPNPTARAGGSFGHGLSGEFTIYVQALDRDWYNLRLQAANWSSVVLNNCLFKVTLFVLKPGFNSAFIPFVWDLDSPTSQVVGGTTITGGGGVPNGAASNPADATFGSRSPLYTGIYPPSTNPDISTAAGAIPSAEAIGLPAVDLRLKIIEAIGFKDSNDVVYGGSAGFPAAYATFFYGGISYSRGLAGGRDSSGVGRPTVINPFPQTVEATGIPSAEAFGSHAVYVEQFIDATGIASDEAIGLPDINLQTIEATGIASDEAIGQPDLSQNIDGNGIVSDEAFGSPTVIDYDIEPNGIASDEAIGSPTVTGGATTTGDGYGDGGFGVSGYGGS